MLLAGDIGGTKINLAIFSPETGPRSPLIETTLPSTGYPSLEALLGEFLSHCPDVSVTRASFGVAGPVVAGRATTTNLPWVIDEKQLQEALGPVVVCLLNDLEAIAYAVPLLESDDLYTLNEGVATPDGALAVIAPGTGLGEAFLTWDGSRYRAQPSEGGHTDFAPTDLLELELLRYLWDRFEHVSYERVCSGLGLPNIYAYLKDSGYADEPIGLADELAKARDATPVIVNNALDPENRCELCVKTLDTFVSILGAEAGNLALKTMATGGVYLGGGIPPRILPALAPSSSTAPRARARRASQGEGSGRFMQAFQNKGRFSDLVARFPVHVILNPKAALLGAAYCGLEM